MEQICHFMKEYTKISFTKSSAERFKKFAKSNSGTNSEVLDKMINFFEYNDVNLDNVDLDVLSVGKLVNKRFNAIYGMLKIMEKEQTKPTRGMLGQIFAQLNTPIEEDVTLSEPVKKPKFIQKKSS